MSDKFESWKNKVIASLEFIWFKAQVPIVVTLIGAFAAGLKLGDEEIKSSAMSALILMLIPLVISINRKITATEKNQIATLNKVAHLGTRYFESFREARNEMFDLAIQAFEKEKKPLRIKWLGTTMQYGTSYLIDLTEALKPKLTGKKINIKLEAVMQRSGNEIGSNRDATTKRVTYYNALKELEDKLRNDHEKNIELHVRCYENSPMITGLLINEKYLFMNYTAWNEGKTDSGHIEYVFHHDVSPIGHRRIKAFLTWFKKEFDYSEKDQIYYTPE